MEQKPKLPLVYDASIEFKLFIREVHCDAYSGSVHHKISIISNGTIYLRETLSTWVREQTLNQVTCESFREFSEKFPEDAQAINEYFGRQKSASFSFFAIPVRCTTR